MPVSDKLLELGRGREGTLAAAPFPVLLQALFLAGRTAVLELKKRNLVKRIALEDGVPVDCESNLAHETTAGFLLEKGKLASDSHQRVLAEAAVAGERVEQTLLRLQLIAPFDLFKLLQQNLAFKILDCFCLAWSDAKYRVLADAPEVQQPLRVNLAQLIFTGVSTFAPFAVVEAGLVELANQKLALTPEPPHELNSLRLNPREARLLAELKRRPSLDELCTTARMPFEELLRKLYALKVLGFVGLASEVPAPPREAPGAPPVMASAAWAGAASMAPVAVLGSTASVAPPAAAAIRPALTAGAPAASPPPAPAPDFALAGDAERLRDEVMAAYLRCRGQDPFDMLGLEETASPQRIRDAFLAWSEKFAPWRFTRPELAGLAEKARDLFLFGARAYGQLAENESRMLVLKRREAARQARERQRSTDFSIRTDLLDARVQHEEAMRRIASGDARGAIAYLEFACDCEPRRALYRAHLAQARFRADPVANARQALAELEEALRIDEACAEAWLVAGEIHQYGNALDRADEAFRRASKLAPGDRRPVEALRVLAGQRKGAG